jgi:hypothetical protein
MIIQIGQDDGVLHGGIPKLVVLTISEGERQTSFPLPADQPISAIYSAAAKALGSAGVEARAAFGDNIPSVTQSMSFTPALDLQPVTGEIQKRDIVKYIGSPSEEGDDLKPGHLYRVLEVRRDTLEIIDDASPTPIRLIIIKSDAELSSKAKPLRHVKKQVMEITTKCTKCGLDLVLTKEKDGIYRGVCDDVCGNKQEKLLEKPRA